MQLNPGSVPIRPTRSAAEFNPDQFYALFESLKGRINLPLSKIADLTNDTTLSPEQNVHKRIKDKRLSAAARSVILRHVFDEEMLLSGSSRRKVAEIPDAFYFAFLNLLGINETSQDKGRALTLGTYRLWRPSAEYEGEYVFGRLDIFEDTATHAICARMIQRKTGEGEGDPSAYEEFSGYFFRVANVYILLLHDTRSRDVRITFFPRYKVGQVGTALCERSCFAGRNDHILFMDGHGTGLDGASVYHAPVHIALEDNVDKLAGLNVMLDVVREGDPRLPGRVLAKLKARGKLQRP